MVFKWGCRSDGLFWVHLSIYLMISHCMVLWWSLGCMLELESKYLSLGGGSRLCTHMIVVRVGSGWL